MKKIWFVLFVLAVVVLVVFLSPYYTLYKMKSAYQQGDYATVLSYVDFEKVQAGVQVDLNSRFDGTLDNNKNLNLLMQVFPQVKDDLIGKVKDEINKATKTAITAKNIEQLLQGNVSSDSEKLIAMWAVASDYVDYEMLIKDTILHGSEIAVKNQEPIVKKRVTERFGKPIPDKIQTSYCGVQCFTVTGSVSGQPVGATLYRTGIVTWKVEKILLP